MSKENHNARLHRRNALKEFLSNYNVMAYFSIERDVLFAKNYEKPYGLASVVFTQFMGLFARLFAYDNKHYFVYKAISNPNKIGYLSRKQYMKFILSQRKGESRDNYLQNHGWMASPYKLLKQAFKENPEKTKWIRQVVGDDEQKLIKFCDYIMQSNTGLEIVEADIDECYAVPLDSGNHAGERFATWSCMRGKKVGGFYKAFGAKGYIVKKNGDSVGRFLVWPLPDGKEYVDRLYIQSRYAEDALAEIDRKWPDAQKYPNFPDTDVKIPMVDPDAASGVYGPYLDSFRNVGRDQIKEGEEIKYYLVRGYNQVFDSTMNTTKGTKRFKKCPHCGRITFSDDPSNNFSEHKWICEKFKPRELKMRKLWTDHKELLKEMEVNKDERIVFEL